jgi:hypothetical protein
MADRPQTTRRAVLQGIVALPAAGPGLEMAPAQNPGALEVYVAFLAHEHRRALVARWPELYAAAPELVPLTWLPAAPGLVRRLEATDVAARAGLVCGALRLL